MAGLRVWEIFADAVLSRAVHERRSRWATEVDPTAGSVVRESDLGRLLAELPLARATDTEPRVDHEPLDAAVAAARTALHEPVEDDPFSTLVRTARLGEIDAEVLAFAAAVGWDPVRRQLAGYVQDDMTPRGPMVAALPRFLGRAEGVIEALAPDGNLRRGCLLELPEGESPGSTAVTVATSVLWFLIGDPSFDPALPHDVVEHVGPPVASAPSLTLVHGLDRVRRLQAAAGIVGTSRLLESPEPDSESGWAALVRAALCDEAAVVLQLETVSPTTRRRVERSPMVPWIISTRSPIALDELPQVPFVEVEVDDQPLVDEEVRSVLGDVPTGHRLTPNQLYLLSRHRSIAPVDAVRRLASGELDKLSQRIRPRRTWSDLVLTPEALGHVREVVVRVRHRSRVYDEWGFRAVPSAGVLALFSGPSGTGKTMSAEVIAGELGLDMFKIDLSALVSKFIGETEKNLERVFGAAEGGGVVLVFDEADAVFGKRAQVKDAQDRYANIETSYLLQRIESFDGLVVLTTNFPGNIDPAFTRRIHVAVEFPMPDTAERRRIWESEFPRTAPLADDVDLDFIAERFKFSGGSIRTAALTAAFAAVDADEPITMAHVVRGIRREYQKLGRIASPSEFGEYFVSEPASPGVG